MKTSLKLLTLVGVLCAGLLNLNAADNKELAGPKGGRLLEKTTPHAEFVIEKDRSVTIHFYNAEMKPIAATTQSATVVATPASGKATIEFEKKGDSLVSKTKLPEGTDYNLVAQFKQSADAMPKNFRFKLDLARCGQCKRAEYACVCGH